VNLRPVYMLLSLFKLVGAIAKGPFYVLRFLFRRTAHKGLSRTMRRSGL
jgi:hypothetical protein